MPVLAVRSCNHSSPREGTVLTTFVCAEETGVDHPIVADCGPGVGHINRSQSTFSFRANVDDIKLITLKGTSTGLHSVSS